MRLIINENLAEKYPSLSFGVLVAKKVNNSRKSTALKQIFDGLTAQIMKQFKGKDINSEPKISNWRTVFNETGAKTFETPMERLLKDILNKKEADFTDNLSKIRDYFMVKWQVPVTCFSLDNIYGDIELDIDKKSVFYRDQASNLTKKWSSGQAERGSLHKETKNAVFIIENLGVLEDEDVKLKLHELAAMVQKYCGGTEFEEDTIRFPRKEKDLDVTGLLDAPEGMEQKASVLEKEKTENPVKTEDSVKEIPSELLEKLPEPSQKQEKTTENNPAEAQEIVSKVPSPIDRYSLKSKLEILIKEACLKAYPEANVEGVKVDYPRESEHGDYACSIAMKLAKQLLKEPIKIAENIIKYIEPVQFIGKVEAAMPGFINIHIARGWLELKVKDFAEDSPLYDTTYGEGNTIVIDFSAPNIAKPLGVHHLLSTIIGQSLYNLFKALGYRVIGDNHLGDWGTQFGKLIYAYRTWGNKKTVEKDPIPELLKLYVKFHEEAEQDPSLEEKGREEFKKMEEGNTENIELWKWFKDLSIADLEKTYATLGIHFDEWLGESFYTDKMEPVIEECIKKGIAKEGEGGALIVEMKDPNMPPFLLKKSDGATLYGTRDLATVEYRIKRWDPQQILYVVDMSQTLAFRQLFETAMMLGYTSAKLEHISFGRMRLPDRSMSTRKGNVVLLEDLIKEAFERAAKIVEEKSPELKKKEKENVAKMVAIGSIKYNILSQNRTTDITFDWDKMLSVEGNSAPYLQYTAARASSILRKYEESMSEVKKQIKPKKGKVMEEESPQTDLFEAIERADGYDDNMKPFEHPTEQAVARQLLKFQEYLIAASEEYRPNLLSNYLYDLAQAFNHFYNSVSVLQADSKHVKLARLNIVKAVLRVLKEGLKILGIEAPSRM